MNKEGFFITGTDTGVGKTWVTASLLYHLRQTGLDVAGLKPVAAGCKWLDGQWKNEDALLLQQNSSSVMPYGVINPYAFRDPASPHVACSGQNVDLQVIQKSVDKVSSSTDIVLVEGAGGWFSPLDENIKNQELAEFLSLPVVLVVGLRLGCINQALLTVAALKQSSCRCLGWVAVTIDDEMVFKKENVSYLQHAIPFPLLAEIPYLPNINVEAVSKYSCHIVDVF